MTDHDRFIQSELTKILESGEEVLNTAYMVKQPGLLMQILLVGGLLLVLMTKAFYVIATNRRIIMIRTKQGIIKPKLVNVEVSSIPVDMIASVKTGGFAQNRSMTFNLRNRTEETLRIAPAVKFITGQKEFWEKVPQRLNSTV